VYGVVSAITGHPFKLAVAGGIDQEITAFQPLVQATIIAKTTFFYFIKSLLLSIS
jgi:hypothetical protein